MQKWEKRREKAKGKISPFEEVSLCISLHTVVLSVSDFASLECQRRACLHINTRAYKLREKRKKYGKRGRKTPTFFARWTWTWCIAALGRGHSTVKSWSSMFFLLFFVLFQTDLFYRTNMMREWVIGHENFNSDDCSDSSDSDDEQHPKPPSSSSTSQTVDFTNRRMSLFADSEFKSKQALQYD